MFIDGKYYPYEQRPDRSVLKFWVSMATFWIVAYPALYYVINHWVIS